MLMSNRISLAIMVIAISKAISSFQRLLNMNTAYESDGIWISIIYTCAIIVLCVINNNITIRSSLLFILSADCLQYLSRVANLEPKVRLAIDLSALALLVPSLFLILKYKRDPVVNQESKSARSQIRPRLLILLTFSVIIMIFIWHGWQGMRGQP